MEEIIAEEEYSHVRYHIDKMWSSYEECAVWVYTHPSSLLPVLVSYNTSIYNIRVLKPWLEAAGRMGLDCAYPLTEHINQCYVVG